MELGPEFAGSNPGRAGIKKKDIIFYDTLLSCTVSAMQSTLLLNFRIP